MRKLIAIASAAVFVLVTSAPAFADAAVQLRGTFGTGDLTTEMVPTLPLSGEPGILVTIQFDTNLGPVTEIVDVPLSTFVFQPNGGFHFQGQGMWDFGNDDVLLT